jgi:hypothetical protein
MRQEEAQGVEQREPRPGSKLASMQIKKRLRTHLKAGHGGNNETHTGDGVTTVPLGRVLRSACARRPDHVIVVELAEAWGVAVRVFAQPAAQAHFSPRARAHLGRGPAGVLLRFKRPSAPADVRRRPADWGGPARRKWRAARRADEAGRSLSAN